MEAHRHIVVGTDFSDAAEHALDVALGLAQRGLTRITLLHSCELSVELGLPDPLATTALDRELVRICGERLAEAVARRTGVELTGVLRSGKPWEKINNVAAEVGASLIVVGRTGAGRALAGELGSVALRVLRTASRPVLTVAELDRARPARSSEAA